MNKPNGYDETQVNNSWEPAKIGGHYMTVRKVTEMKASTGKDMIVVEFDFAKNDVQPGYFLKLFQDDTRDPKKWPYAGTSYIMVNDYLDSSKTSKNFKTFITSVEKSNKGFQTSWGGDNWGKQFEGKRIGGVFGNVESEWNGITSMRSQLRWFCSVDNVPTAKIPADKCLKVTKPEPVVTGHEDFMQVPDTDMDGIPF